MQQAHPPWLVLLAVHLIERLDRFAMSGDVEPYAKNAWCFRTTAEAREIEMSGEAIGIVHGMRARLQKAVNSANAWHREAQRLEAKNKELIDRLAQREAVV